MNATFRNKVGCFLHERFSTERVLWGLGGCWQDLKNRHEQLERHGRMARKCLWQDSSALTVCKVFPDLGSRLLQHALNEWPVELKSSYDRSSKPDYSVLIATGGADRVPQFQMSLQSVLGQRDASHEIVVVEQSPSPLIADLVPDGVLYEHQSCVHGEFNKSRALNRAACLAKGKWLCVHDADFLIPARFLSSCTEFLSVADALRPARWIVHLTDDATREICRSETLLPLLSVEKILQNTPNPMVFTKQSFEAVGGMDESFIGWGGEDLEFLSRLRTHEMIDAGYLPVIHLWHPPAERKESGDRNQELQDQRLAEPASARIERLRASYCESHA